MDINIQIFTGSCLMPAHINVRNIIGKLEKIFKQTHITNALIGWNTDIDISEIISYLKSHGTELYLWLPVFSELNSLASFAPLIGHNGKKIEFNYAFDSGESFSFCCPASQENRDKIIAVYDEYYAKNVYDGIFLDKIRFPSFIEGFDCVVSCQCDYCRTNYDVPASAGMAINEDVNPFNITAYQNLHYVMDSRFAKLFDYKNKAVTDSLIHLCNYFRGKGLKIGLDLFAPFFSYFVGQNYERLLPLADMVKPMFYNITNAPAGLPFEIDKYAAAFDKSDENMVKRKEHLKSIIGYGNGFIGNEIAGIRKIIADKRLNTKLYAGIELNYIEHIAPVSKAYLAESAGNIRKSDGIVMSWDLNIISDENIDFMLNQLS